MPTIHVEADEVLSVSAGPGGGGKIALEGTKLQWSVSPGTPLHLGPGIYHTTGDVICAKNGQVVAALEATLPARTERVVSERIVTAAIVDGLQARRSKSTMGLADKARLLAERAKAIPAKHSDRMDAISARLESADARATDAADRIEIAVVAQVEQSAVEMEDVANQLSNAFGDVPNG